MGGSWRAIARIHMERLDYPLKVLHGYAPAGRELLETLAWIREQDQARLGAVSGGSSAQRLSLVPLAVFGVLVQRRIRSAWLLLPLAALAWVLMHESGVHATVAGVLLAFTVPVVRSDAAGGPDAGPGLAEHFEHRIRPLSAAVAVPVFAFFSAGVTVGGLTGLGAALGDTVPIVGFYCQCEIAPLVSADLTLFHNATMVSVLLGSAQADGIDSS